MSNENNNNDATKSRAIENNKKRSSLHMINNCFSIDLNDSTDEAFIEEEILDLELEPLPWLKKASSLTDSEPPKERWYKPFDLANDYLAQFRYILVY